MRTFRERFQALAMAAAFAEEQEWETALSFIEGKRKNVEDRPSDAKKRPDRRPRQQTYHA